MLAIILLGLVLLTLTFFTIICATVGQTTKLVMCIFGLLIVAYGLFDEIRRKIRIKIKNKKNAGTEEDLPVGAKIKAKKVKDIKRKKEELEAEIREDEKRIRELDHEEEEAEEELEEEIKEAEKIKRKNRHKVHKRRAF